MEVADLMRVCYITVRRFGAVMIRMLMRELLFSTEPVFSILFQQYLIIRQEEALPLRQEVRWPWRAALDMNWT